MDEATKVRLKIVELLAKVDDGRKLTYSRVKSAVSAEFGPDVAQQHKHLISQSLRVLAASAEDAPPAFSSMEPPLPPTLSKSASTSTHLPVSEWAGVVTIHDGDEVVVQVRNGQLIFCKVPASVKLRRLKVRQSSYADEYRVALSEGDFDKGKEIKQKIGECFDLEIVYDH